uniref:Uncharacterized protein n=1 Tax=Zea mays TaxID=4577 RepID=A0A804ULV0_MAIZE
MIRHTYGHVPAAAAHWYCPPVPRACEKSLPTSGLCAALGRAVPVPLATGRVSPTPASTCPPAGATLPPPYSCWAPIPGAPCDGCWCWYVAAPPMARSFAAALARTASCFSSSAARTRSRWRSSAATLSDALRAVAFSTWPCTAARVFCMPAFAEAPTLAAASFVASTAVFPACMAGCMHLAS